MDVLSRGKSAKITFCDNCGSQLMYKAEDVYTDVIQEQQGHQLYRYSVKFLVCPVCKHRILLDKTYMH
jgi:DNA-directed RNA polymerase subunit RPC12/RpoP